MAMAMAVGLGKNFNVFFVFDGFCIFWLGLKVCVCVCLEEGILHLLWVFEILKVPPNGFGNLKLPPNNSWNLQM